MSELGIVMGGSGFIGGHLLKHLVSTRRHRRLISIDIAPPPERLEGVDYVTADLCDELDPGLGATGSVVYSLAAHRNYPGHPDQDYYVNNVVSSQRIIDFAETTGAQAIVFTSTMSVYGPGEEPKTEKSALNPVNPYGASKMIAETLHRGWRERDATRKLVICRPAVIFGYRDDGNYTRLARALQKRMFVYAGRSDTVKSAGYVGDLVESFTFALDHGKNDILYNFAYPYPYTIKEIVEAFEQVAGFSRPWGVMPVAMLNAAAIPFEAANALGFRNSIHRQRIRKLYEDTHIVPEWLTENGFVFSTDLPAALRRWREESPGGRFV